MIGLILLVLIGFFVVLAVKSLFARSSGSGGNLPHPNLKQCPGCGAPLTESSDVCPQCGLRIS